MSTSLEQVVLEQINSIESNTFSTTIISIKRDRDKFRKHFINVNFCFLLKNINDLINTIYFFSSKVNHQQFSQYTIFRQKKLSKLLKKNVFKIINFDDVSKHVRVFNLRFVNKIKHLNTNKIFEKSKLIVQTYNDFNKNLMLISLLTIQQVNQRLIVCLAATLQNELYLKNVTQAYVQFAFNLNRDFYICLFIELITLFDIFVDCILKIVKSFYEIFETSNY